MLTQPWHKQLVVGGLLLAALSGLLLAAGAHAQSEPPTDPVQPGKIEEIAPKPTPEPEAALPPFPAAQLDAVLAQYGGTYGILVYDVPGATMVYTRNVDLAMPAASLIKLPIAFTVYEQAQAGQVSLDDVLTLRAEDIVGGSGAIQNHRPGSTYTLRDLTARKIYDSDNTATNMVIRHVGGFAPVNTLMDTLGITQTELQRFLMDFEARQAGRDNWTSPADMLRLLQLLDAGEVVGATGQAEILQAMGQTRNARKLPALLPPEAVVLHKTGELSAIEHDVGVVVLPNQRRYLVVLMSQDLPGNQAGIAALAEVSRLIYEYEQGIE